MQSKLRCPKCRVWCVSRGNNPSICIADGPAELNAAFPNETEFKFRIWSYMQPPRISEPLSSVNPDRLEIVRDLLQGSSEDKPCSVHVYSKVNLQLLRDGSIRKILSRTERKTYPPKNRTCDEFSSSIDSDTGSSDFTFHINEVMSSTRK